MIPVVAVAGPTASGKTSLAVSIALSFSGEVVSCDSMQIYKGMSVATAKPTEEEMCSVPHHMIDFLDENMRYSVSDYVRDAKKCIADIYARGHLPIVCGGTGLYMDSLLTNTDFGFVPDNTQMRDMLQNRLKSEGGAKLLDELREIDPETAARLHENNSGRIIRALEVYYLTGETISERIRCSRLTEQLYDVCYIGINFKDRDALYSRIDKRVDNMLSSGLLEEAEKYISLDPGTTAVQAIGYKELKPYFDGVLTLDEAVDNLKRATRRYAKRQLTWFRRNDKINWVYPDGEEDFVLAAKRTVSDFLGKDAREYEE